MPLETTEVLVARYGSRLRWYATGTAMLGMVAAVVTTTIVNVAIPDIMGAFGIGQDQAQWFMTGALSAMIYVFPHHCGSHNGLSFDRMDGHRRYSGHR